MLDRLVAEYEQMEIDERMVISHSGARALWYQASLREVLDRPADRVL